MRITVTNTTTGIVSLPNGPSLEPGDSVQLEILWEYVEIPADSPVFETMDRDTLKQARAAQSIRALIDTGILSVVVDTHAYTQPPFEEPA
jgi:hypothetical protein